MEINDAGAETGQCMAMQESLFDADASYLLKVGESFN